MRTALPLALAILYGGAAVVVFCLSGVFGDFARMPLRDVALVLVTVVAACALTYISLLLMTFLQRETTTPGDPDALDWHLLIPCRDEESVIAATVSAARTSFSGAHVWVIDDASEDATAAVVENLRVFDDRVHLISRVAPHARTGKGDALNAAYLVVSEQVGTDPAQRQRTVIGVLDADGYLSDNALACLAGPEAFGDPHVGAGQVEVWMKNRGDRLPRPGDGRLKNLLGRILVRMQDLEFRTTNSAMQLLRQRTGTVGMGGNGQFTRISVLDEIAERRGAPWGRKLSEDYELGLNILELGHATHYSRAAHVSQEALPFLRRLLTQRTRWAQGNMECAANLPALRRSGSLRPSGLAEIHYFMLQPLIMMLNLLLVPLLLVLAWIDGAGSFWSASTLVIVIIAGLIFLVIPYAAWGVIYQRATDAEVSVVMGLGLGLANLLYVYLTYIFYARAASRLLTGQTSWAKTRRNADGTLGARVELDAALAAEPLVRLEVFDELTEEIGGRRDLGREFVAGYAIMWPTRLARLEQAVAAEETHAARDAVGSIRTASAMVGASRLEQATSRLTEVLGAGDYGAGRDQLAVVRTVGHETMAALRDQIIIARVLPEPEPAFVVEQRTIVHQP